MKIGILNLQGGVVEHIYLLKKAFNKREMEGEIIIVDEKSDLEKIDGIILPGGESTTIGRLLTKMDMVDALREFIINGHPTLGICAGAILMAKEAIDYKKGRVNQPLLRVMNIRAIRNYFGTQKNSFETLIKIDGLNDTPFRAIFIRAPVFEKISNEVEELAHLQGKIIMAKEENMLITSFHPELTNDSRIHELFLSLFK